MASLVAATTTAAAFAATGGSPQPYPMLVERDGLRVYAPAQGQPWGRCPHLPSTIAQRHHPAAARATLLAVPILYRGEPQIDIRGATARAERMYASLNTRWGLARSSCGARVTARTVAVHVRFPRVRWSASLSSATFFVSRIPTGWIIWHQAH